MRRFILMILLAATLAFPRASYAWNEVGHMTVALIAYRRLDDQQKQQIAAVLKQHPHYTLYLSANVPDGVNVDEWAFIRAAVWPDWVRPSRPGDRGFKDATITHFHHGAWHYTDIPFVPPSERSHLDPTTRAAKPPEDILTALDGVTAQLKSADTKPEDRAVALAWLLHLVGDIHQPLHATSLFSAAYPDGDKGGNDEAINAGGTVMRLHQYWDDLLGTSDAYEGIDFLATEIALEPECDVTKLKEYGKNTTFASWADESFHLAGAMVYLNGRLRSVPGVQWESHQLSADQVPSLLPSYVANARELAKQRVSLAGVRLADQLNGLFKP